MKHIVVDNGCLGASCLLTGENFQNLFLWKPRIGEAITVCDSGKRFFRARITRLEHTMAEVLIFEELDGSVESDREITLLQALPEKERMELIIQKTTELGVSSIIPFKSRRSTSIDERDAKQKKSHKWGEVALKAAKQCRRAAIPQIKPCRNFADAIASASGYNLKLLLWENEKAVHLKGFIKGIQDSIYSIAIMIGPEGGLEKAEVEEAQKAGFLSVGLGQRILRTETAAIIMVGLIQYELGNLG